MLEVLYIGQLGVGSTCQARARMLAERGWKIHPINTVPYLNPSSRLVRALEHRLLDGPNIRQLNSDILEISSELKKIDVVWVDKGRQVFPETLIKLKEKFHSTLVHFTPDPAFSVHNSRHFLKSLQLYDHAITTKRYELQAYRDHCKSQVHFTLQGIDERFSRLPECQQIENAQGRNGLVFIGHCEKHYLDTLSQLVQNNLPVRIHGANWPKLTRNDKRFDLANVQEAVYGDGYVKSLAAAAIGVGLLSKFYPDAYTTRTFEIPATGAMLLAEDTEEHRELYEADKEAVFFATAEEMVDKAKFYLENGIARVKIAKKGREKTLQKYTWKQVMQDAVNAIEGTVGVEKS